jgi:hypothetical protein
MTISEETIDLYLRGDLSGSDLETFNNAIASDPKLRQELDFQNDIVNSLKQYRHQQLKGRFNSIEIPAGTAGGGLGSSIYLKFAASIGIVAALMGGTALWLNNQSDTESTVAVNSTTSNPETGVLILKNNTPESNSRLPEQTKPAAEKGTNNTATVKKEDKNTATQALSSKKGNNVNVDVPTSENLASEQYSDHSTTDFEVPSMNDGNTNSSVQNIKVNIVKEKDLAYRFFNNQLFLHGNFSNSPYELYELNTSPEKRLYLYFETNYYELIQGKTKTTALTPIKDKATLNQLNQLKER